MERKKVENENSEIIPLSDTDIAPVENAPVLISEEVKSISPVLKIETGLSSFLNSAFDIAIKEQAFHDQIEKEIVSRLPNLKNSELIALQTSNRTNQNDLYSKLIAPTLQLATARQQNEMAKTQKEATTTISQTNIQELNQAAPQDVLTGLKAMFDIFQVMKKPEEVVEYQKTE